MTFSKNKVKKTITANGVYLNEISDINVTATRIEFLDADGNLVFVTPSTSSPVIIDTHTTSITVTGATASVNINGDVSETSTLIVYNQDDRDVTFECTFESSEPTLGTTGGTYGQVITAIATGTTTITATHEDSVTGSTDIVITNIVNSLAFVPISGSTASGSTFTVRINDQSGRNITAYCALTTQAGITFVPGTGVISVATSVSAGSKTLVFTHTASAATANFTLAVVSA